MTKNILGSRVGRLVVIRLYKNSSCVCECDCGNEKIVKVSNLEKTKSCGCLRKELASKLNFKHGERESLEYTTWRAMIERCGNPHHKHYKNYGGRGIRVFEGWKDFKKFLEDMGRKPTPNHTIDRIDNNKDYEPTNCRWELRDKQNQNRRGWK